MTAPPPPLPDGTAEKVADAAALIADIRRDTADVTASARWIDDNIPIFGGPIAQWIYDGMRQVTQFLDELQSYLDAPGIPPDLVSVGAAWAVTVQQVVSGVGTGVTPSTLPVGTAWKGPAAAAYRDVLRPQKDALESVSAACPEINTAFSDLAAGIDSYWTSVKVALIALAVAIAALAVGLRAATTPWAAAGAAITFLGAVATCVGASMVAQSTVDAAALRTRTVLQNRLGNNIGFPGGKWPTSTRISGNASMANGAESDWQLVE